MRANLRARLWVAACVVLAAAGIAISSGGCGILFFPVTLPAAIGENRNVSLKGTIVDQTGQPLRDVIIHVNNSHVYWDPIMVETTKNEDKDVVRSGTFDFPWVRGHSVGFTFTKAGYRERKIAMSDQGYDELTEFGRYWPTDVPARIVMPDVNQTRTVALHRGTVSVSPPLDGSQNEGNAWVYLDGSMMLPPSSARQIPTGATVLTLDFVSQPLKTKGADRAVDVLDVGLPASVTLGIIARNSQATPGFVRFVPVVGSDPFEQMSEAPEAGYVPEIVLGAPRLKEMRKAGKDCVIAGHEFYFFRAGRMYGKLAVSWGDRPADAQTEVQVTEAVQLDGTRDLSQWGVH